MRTVVLAYHEIGAESLKATIANGMEVVAVVNEERELARGLDGRAFLLRILHGGQTLVADVRTEEVLRRLAQAFDDAFA